MSNAVTASATANGRGPGLRDVPGLRDMALACAPAAAYLTFRLLRPVEAALLEPDSASYLDFAPSRSAGYPLFLQIRHLLGNGVDGIPTVQLVLYALSVAVLALAALRTTGSWLAGAVLSAGLCVNPLLDRYHFVLLSESPFLAVSALLLAVLIALEGCRRQGAFAGLVALLSALAGLAIALRPAAYALLPLIPIVLLLHWPSVKGRVAFVVLAGAVPAAVVIGGEHLVHQAWHDGRTSLLGLHLFAKAGMVEAPVAPVPATAAGKDGETQGERLLDDALERDLEPVRALVAAAPDFGTRNFLLVNYEVFVQYGFALDLRSQVVSRSGRSTNDVLGATAWRRLSRAPGAYLRLTLEHYRGLWTVFSVRHPDTAPGARAFVERHRPLPFESQVLGLVAPIEARALARLVRPAIQTVGWLSLGAMLVTVLGVLGRRPITGAARVAAICAFMLHGSFLLVALTGVGISRYTLGMWPAMVVFVGALVLAAFRGVVTRAAGSRSGA